MYKLELECSFAAAHQLTNAYDEKCNASKHGHNWKVKVAIEAQRLHKNMVIDFTKVKEVINFLDHKDLNTILDFEPTAENLSKYIYDKLAEEMNKLDGFYDMEVAIWEAEKASITYRT